MSNVITESELEAFRMVNSRGTNVEGMNMKKVREAADKIIELADRIQSERGQAIHS